MNVLNNSAATIREYDNKHVMHPWESMGDEDSNRTISHSAENIYITDQNGRKLIDGPGGMWCTQIGYGRQEMADAIAEQVMQMSYNSPWNTASGPAAMLAKKLADFAPGDINTVFFTTGGSTAVDTALRYVHFYNNRLGRPNKKIILAREKGYHGSTYLAASVTGKERSKTWLDLDTENTHILPNVNPQLRPSGMDLAAWCDEKVADLEKAIEVLGADNIGAFIAEPILASGGVIIPPDGYHKRTLEICRAHDIIYISDEVVTGFGRLGHWFASKDVFDIEPDIITCAKGLTSGYLPLGACLISDRVLEPISGAGHEDIMFSNGYTYSGHPVCCAAALKNIEIIEREGILQHVLDITPHFHARVNALRKSPIVGDTRGLGLVGCVEGRLPIEGDRLALDHKFGETVDAKCEELGLIVRPIINMCVFSPPLVITEKQIDDMFDILEAAISEVEKEVTG